MSEISGIVRASGLTQAERDELEALLRVYDGTRERNRTLESYYEGDVMVKDIGVDVLPAGADVHVDLTCDWPRKAVHSLASLVKFDGFAFDGGERDKALDDALLRCNFRSAFARNRTGMLKKGCMFATVNSDGLGSANVRFHSADSAAAIMDVADERIRSGFVIARCERTAWSPKKAVPTQVNLHMAGRCVAMRRVESARWVAEHVETALDRPMMVPFVYMPTDAKPLGGTRITRQVRDLVDDVLRVRLAMALSTAFYATPMRAVLGLTDEAYAALMEKPKWATYINPMLLATMDEDGHRPELTQLPSVSPQPLIELIYADAKLFSGSTGVPLNSLGIVQDNPSSAEAIAEGRKDLTDEAQALIEEQLVPAMRDVALMVMAVEHNTSVEGLDDVQRSVMPHFANPAMPSIASRTDAAMKIASVRPEFAYTDEFYSMVGFDQATISRINSQMRQAQARQGLTLLMGGQRGEAPDAGQTQVTPTGQVGDAG